MPVTAKTVAVALSYFLLASAAIWLTRLDEGVALLWVAGAPLLNFLCKRETSQWWPALLWTAAAASSAALLFGPVPWIAPLLAIVCVLEVPLAALLLRRWLGHCRYFETTGSVFLFAAIVGLISPLASGLIGATLAHFAFGSPWFATYLDWVLGHGLGMLIVCPVVTMLCDEPLRVSVPKLARQIWGKGGVLLGIVAATTAGVFAQSTFPLLFLPVLPVLLATFKLGRAGAAIAVLIVAAIGGVATATGHGPIMVIEFGHAAQFQFFQFYLAALFVMALPIAGALGQRQQLLLALTRSEAQHRESNRLFAMASGLAEVGHWRYDMVGANLFWSDELFEIHGLEPGVPPSFADAIAAYHPEDRAKVERIVTYAMAAGEPYQFTARLIRPDGSVRHVVSRGQAEPDEHGEVAALFGVFQDITNRTRAEAKVRESEARLRLITESASDIIVLIGLDRTCLFASPACQAILGVAPEALIGTRLFDRIDPDDRESMDRHREVLLAGGDPGPVRVRMRRADGSVAWLEANSSLSTFGRQRCFVTVWRDVSQQVAIEAELRAARSEAEAASAAKADFLANMSHEIRTPMNGVIGFTELLLASELTPEQHRDVKLIADSGRAMMKLLNDILDLSKIEAGHFETVAEPFDLHHALRACGKLLTPSVVQKGVTFAVELADDLPQMVIGDALRLRQIVLNLLGNAIKFTEHGGVTLSARVVDRAEGPLLALAIADTGIGISLERQQSIFEDFVQADRSIARRYGGSGLGLAISQRLARLLGGEIGLTSQPGEGTTATLMLPLAVCGGAPATIPGEIAAAHARVAQHAASILLAEDHDVNQLLVHAMLTRAGHEVTIVDNGRAAVEEVQRSTASGVPYDLILMDVQMPELDGLAATREIRRAERAAGTHVPIVALTANVFAADLEACRAAGLDDHLAKPVAMDALLGMVARWSPPRDGAAPGSKPHDAGSLTGSRSSPFRPGAAARSRYAAQRALVLDHVDQLVRRGTFTDQELGTAAELLHKLAGSAGMFGEAALGDQASSLEEGLRSWPPAERRGRVPAAAALLRNAV